MKGWRSFKTNPPYDCKEDENAGLETDCVIAFIAYRYTHRPFLNNKIFVSEYPSKFFDGVFTDYAIEMRDAKYPESRIEVVAWLLLQEANEILLNTFRSFYDPPKII